MLTRASRVAFRVVVFGLLLEPTCGRFGAQACAEWRELAEGVDDGQTQARRKSRPETGPAQNQAVCGETETPLLTPKSGARNIARDVEPAKLIAPMLGRFMASDRAFARARRIT
jgi:hypothetical protein